MEENKQKRRWLIIEDSPKKAEYLMDNILTHYPNEDVLWFYPYRDTYIDAVQLNVDKKDYKYNEPLKRAFSTKQGKTTYVTFYWLKTRDEFFQYFGREAKRGSQILFLDVQLQLFGNNFSVEPYVEPLRGFIKHPKSLISLITSASNPQVQAKLIDQNAKNLIWGDYAYEYGNDYYGDCERIVKDSVEKWHLLYGGMSSIETFLKKMSRLSVAAAHNWNNQTADSIREYVKEGSWDAEWQMPLQLSLLIKLLGFEPDWFIDVFSLKRNGNFVQGHPIAECLKTLGNEDDGSISLLGATFITWAAYRNVFGDLYPDGNEKFIQAIQNCPDGQVARYRLITPIQENPTLQKTILALYEMMKQLMTNYDNNKVTNFKSMKLSEKGLFVTLQNLDFKQLSLNLSEIYKKRFISKEAQHANAHTTSNRIVDYFAYSNYNEVPGLDKSTPTFGNFFGLRIYPTNVDDEIVLRFEHKFDKPVKKQDFISVEDIAERKELKAVLEEHEKERLLAINDENSENFATERKELEHLITEGETFERQGDFTAAKKKYDEATDVNRFYLKAWEKLSQLHKRIPSVINITEVSKEKEHIIDVLKFERNIFKLKYMHGAKISNVPFFDNFDVEFKKVNVILGKNGYGKTYFLRLLAALASQEKEHIKNFLDSQSSPNSRASNKKGSLKLQLSDTTAPIFQYIVSASPSRVEGESGRIPILAIPETRFIDKSSNHIKRSELFDIRNQGANHFIEQESFSDIINSVLFALGLEMLNKTIDEKPFLEFVKSIMKTLTGNTFFDNARPVGFGDVRIDVFPQGSNRPIPIQKASQGTLSIISIFSLVYVYLSKLYPKYKGENLLKQPAIVFIDEVDAHLHPSWQKKIVILLTETFSNVQFFFAAHSPHVAAGRYEGEVSVLRKTKNGKFALRQPRRHFVGATNEELYKIIFDVEDKDETYLSGYDLEKKIEQNIPLSEQEKKQYEIFKKARAKRREIDKIEMNNVILERELKRQKQHSDLTKEIVYLMRKEELDDEEKEDLEKLETLYEKYIMDDTSYE